MQSQIRPAQLSDLDLLRQIELECFGKSAVPLSQFRWLLEGQGEDRTFEIRVAVESGADRETVMGFVCWKVRRDLEKPAYEILDLSVGKNFREESVEHALVERVFEEAVRGNCIGISVNVPQTNLAAASFYLKCGFQLMHSVPKYYDDGTGMDVMVRRVR